MMKKHSPGKSPPVIDIYDPYASPARSRPSRSRKKGKRFKFVSTRMGIRRSSSRRRHRSSSRRRNSLSSRSSGIYGIDHSIVNAEPSQDKPRRQAGASTSSAKDGLPTFLQRRIPPSIRKVKKTNHGKENYRPVVDMTSLMAQSSNLRNAEVELPFFMPAIESPDVINLSSCATEFKGAIVRPLHHSILGKDYCFEVVVGDSSRCFGCGSAGEREAWIEKIKRAIDPSLDNSRRMEFQLNIFVQEAKGLPSKKKYFCEICLDRKLCAKTTSKWKTDSTLFWGEQFEFSSMPDIQDVTVHLYKDPDKKKKKDKDYVGLINLPASSLVSQQFLEKWYTLSTPSGNNKTKAGEPLALRIKAKYLSIQVLPTDRYQALAGHVADNYLNVCRSLGNHISVTRKGEIARSLVHIMHATGHMKEYMTDVVMREVERVEEESLIFRENTIGTKSVEAMLRLVGMKYLSDTLGDFVLALFNMDEECEVDGGRLPPHASLVVNQKNLHMSCEVALGKITSSVSTFPSELREVLSSWRVKCEEAGRPRIANRLVTASLFLRLLCPAILNPSLFGLANEVPSTKVSRSLTLIAKVIQNLANRSRFGNKEEYMQFMDAFVREKWDDMGSFINNVSDPSIALLHKGFQGFIDLGKELAKLHAFFVELLPELDQEVVDKLGNLPSILDEITAALEEPTEGCGPSSHDNVVARPGSAELTEEAQPPQDLDHLVHPACSSSMTDGRGFIPTTGASSLLDLRDFINAHEDAEDVPVPPAAHGIFPLRQGSNPALPITCSYNNNNNTTTRPTLVSTENLMERPDLINEPDPMNGPDLAPGRDQTEPHGRSPLMFANPAYRASKWPGHTTQEAASSIGGPGFPVHDSDAATPISFSESLPHQRHLETVFTTETTTYAVPTCCWAVPITPNHGFQPSTNLHRQPSPPGNIFPTDGAISDILRIDKSLSFTPELSTVRRCRADSSDDSETLASTRQIHPSNATLSTPLKIDAPATTAYVNATSDVIVSSECEGGLMASVGPLSPASYSSRHQPRGRPCGNSANPQCGPTTSLAMKVTVPLMTSSRCNAPKASPRRASCEGAGTNPEESSKCSGLPQLNDDVTPELVDATDVTPPRHNNRGRTRPDDQVGIVSGTVPLVALCGEACNAKKVKNSTHASPCGYAEMQNTPRKGAKAQLTRHPEATPTQLPPQWPDISLPPTTSESQLSPEARTAQWILSSAARGGQLERKGEIVLTPKDYEDRIIRLKREIERLKGKLSESSSIQLHMEQREAALLEKVNCSERREMKTSRRNQEREDQMHKVMQRLNKLEAEQRRDREEYKREVKELESLLELKEQALMEQRMIISRLEGKLRLCKDFDRSNPRNDGKSCLQSPPDPTDTTDVQERSLRQNHIVSSVGATSLDVRTVTSDLLNFDLYCNGQLHYDDSAESSSNSV